MKKEFKYSKSRSREEKRIMQSNCCLMELELKEQRNCSKSFSPEYLNNGETSLLFGLKILLIEYHFGVESLKSHFFQALKEVIQF